VLDRVVGSDQGGEEAADLVDGQWDHLIRFMITLVPVFCPQPPGPPFLCRSWWRGCRTAVV
jgi:hypothetical protein